MSASSPLAPPLRTGSVSLTVHDLAGVGAFYENVIGLARLSRDAAGAVYGVGATPLVRLNRDAAARRSAPREAGLFHTAFLLPERGDLARWISHAGALGVTLQGASDHLVSEALYLADPEGNGIEIYVDRPADQWSWVGGSVQMATERLNFDALMPEAAGRTWQGAPAGATVGHVHLQVGALEAAEAFYAGVLGFDVTCHYPGATFYSTGGYHHHLATNIWNSRGAGLRAQPATGLSEVTLIASGQDVIAGLAARGGAAVEGGVTLVDPYGTRLTAQAA